MTTEVMVDWTWTVVVMADGAVSTVVDPAVVSVWPMGQVVTVEETTSVTKTFDCCEVDTAGTETTADDEVSAGAALTSDDDETGVVGTPLVGTLTFTIEVTVACVVNDVVMTEDEARTVVEPAVVKV